MAKQSHLNRYLKSGWSEDRYEITLSMILLYLTLKHKSKDYEGSILVKDYVDWTAHLVRHIELI